MSGNPFLEGTDFTRMISTDATIDSFVQNSMAFIRKNNFDGIDFLGEYQAFCDTPEQCSLPSRAKVLLEKFRSAIESENVLPADKMIISAQAGPRKSQIYKANGETSTTTTSNKTTFLPEEPSDLKIEIWAPVLAVIFLAVLTTLIIWRAKRANAKITQNCMRFDRNTRDQNLDDTGNENYYNQPYTANEEYEGHYAEYKKPEK